jgi:5-methylcytosine-specific restriction endonuclease McrA
VGSIDAPLTAVRGTGSVRRALVLNASYEPLSIVSTRRAVCLVIDEKADMIEADGAVIRSESLAIQVPAVIRLRYMVRVPRRRIAAVSRRGVFARDEFRCQYCGERADSIDHVVPRSRGGPHEWENLAASCRPCNTAKRDRTPDEAGMRLLRPCRAPRAAAWVVLGSALVPELWKPYIPLAS